MPGKFQAMGVFDDVRVFKTLFCTFPYYLGDIEVKGILDILWEMRIMIKMWKIIMRLVLSHI